jgi:hypothetical protein
MTAEEITAEALQRGLLTPTGKIPVKSMEAVLYGHADYARYPERVCETSGQRAKRGTVRWRMRE